MQGSEEEGLFGMSGARMRLTSPAMLSRFWPAASLLFGLALSACVAWYLRRYPRAAVLGALLCISLMAMVWLLYKGRRQSQALSIERERLHGIIEGTGAGTWEWNWVTGETRYGDRWAEILGFRPSEIPSDSRDFWRDRVHPDDLRRADDLLQRHVQGLSPSYECELRIRHVDGHWVWVLSRGKVCSRTADGRPFWVAGADLDMSERHAMEDDLRASEMGLNRAGRMAGVGSWEIELPTNTIYWSPQTCLMQDRPVGFQPTLEEALAHYPPQAQPVVQAAVARMVEGHATEAFEVPLITATGRRIQVRIVGEAMLPDAPGEPVRRLVGSVQDVTASREMEQALLRGNALLRSIVDNMPCALAVYDQDSNLIVHNEQFKRLYEFPDHLFEGPPVTLDRLMRHYAERGEFGSPEAAEIAIRKLKAYTENPVARVFESRRPAGGEIEINAAPLPGGGYVFIGLDLSERKRSERLLQGAVNAIDEAFALFDPEDRLVFCNDTYRQAHAGVAELLKPGARFEDIQRARIADDPPQDALGREEDWLAERLAQRQRGNTKIVKRTGGGRWARLIERRLADGHIADFRMDITDLMLATEAAEKASLAKSQFLANMSHEIRTPMNAVLGMLKLLQRTPLTQRQQDYASKTEGAARSLLGLLNDILDFSKVEAGKMSLDLQPMRIDELLRDLSVILAANIGHREIEVLFDVDPHLPRSVIADAMRLQQVLINLAGNAIKFTREGEVVVQLKLVELEAQAVTLDFAVRDTGIGIAPEHQEQIFSGFTQAEASTTRRFGGTGLGLAISRRLVRLMDSELELESELGRGSRFFFRLRLELPEQQPEPHERSDARVPMRVLVVDDNAYARQLLATMCESLGWLADLADSGAAALDRVRGALQSGEAYQVALIDWAMAGMDGWETARAVRSLTRGGPAPVVVMVSAHGREMLSQRSPREQGLLDAFLVKPVTASMLYDAVADARSIGPKTDFDRMQGALAEAEAGRDDAPARPLLPGLPVPWQGGARRLAGLRLLVVEDNLNNQQIARELLEDEGARIVVAGDGQQALSELALAHQRGRIDAVLMDVQMPLMDGYTATRLIRRQLRMSLPIIAMTANARASDRQACLDAGMTEHVGKPFDIDHLVAVLQLHCAASLGAEAAPAPAVPTAPHRPAAEAAWPAGLAERAQAAGIQLAQALARMSGKSELFLRSAQALGETARALPEPLTARALHGLRGLAATLGAVELAELSAEGERAIEEGSNPSPDWRARFDATLRRDLPALVELARQLPGAEPEAAAEPIAESVSGVLSAALGSDLALLVELLEGSDMAALDTFTHLRARLRAQRPGADEDLDAALARLDFASAAAQCRVLLLELDA